MGAKDKISRFYPTGGGKVNVKQQSRIDHGQRKKQLYGLPEPVSPPTTTDDDDDDDDDDEEEEEQAKYIDGDWKVTLSTLKEVKHGHVVMVIYGIRENSTRIILNPKGKNELFQAGSIDEFKINLKEFGKITKIRMELVPKYPQVLPKWKVKEVKLQNMKTKELLKFKFNCWLSRTKGKRELMAELPAIRPGQKVLPVLQYHVQVYTAGEPGADTEANVYLNLFGGLGDTGKRMLLDSDKSEKFQEAQMDAFTIEAVSVGSVKRCIVSCDGDGPGEGWKCSKIIVKEHKDSSREFCFPCNKWMDRSVGDGRCQRILKAKRAKFDVMEDGRGTFFHRLTGNQPGVVQIVPSDGEDSDPGFYKRHKVNMASIQPAVYLKKVEDEQPDKKLSGYSYLKLPRIDSPLSVDSPERYPGKSSKNDVKLPDIHESSQSSKVQRKTSVKRLQNRQSYEKRHARPDDSSDSEEETTKYPWESAKNRKIINKALSEKKIQKNKGKQKPQIDVSHLTSSRINRDDLSSGADSVDEGDVRQQQEIVHQDEKDDISVYSSKNGHKYLRDKKKVEKEKPHDAETERISEKEKISDKQTNKKSESETVEKKKRNKEIDSVPAVYMGNIKKTKPLIESRNKAVKVHHTTHDSNSRNETKSVISKSPNESTNNAKINASKYYPRTKKGEFPWEHSRRAQEKPKTALVRPTQREDLNKLTRKGTFVKNKASKKYENIDSHFPSRVEIRLMARRARLQKQRPGTVKPQKRHPVVSKKLFVGFGLIDERLQKRRERQQKELNDNPSENLYNRRPDNLALSSLKGAYYGSIRTEERAKLKKERQRQKEEKQKELLAKEESEKKPKIPVYMPPVHKDKAPGSYGDNYHAKKSKSSSLQNTKPNTSDKPPQYNTNSRSGAKNNKSGPAPITAEDDDIWNYFASVVDNLKTIEAREKFEEDNYNNNDIAVDQANLPPGFV